MKVGGTERTEEALNQIAEKHYATHYAHYGLPIRGIGLVFDNEKHRIVDWFPREKKQGE